MGAQHKNTLGNFIHHEAAKKGHFVREHTEPYKKPEDVQYRIYALHSRRKGLETARVRTQVLPGCCGVLLLHNFSGSDDAVATLIEIITRAAARANFGEVLFSLISGHHASTPISEFRNPKTGRNVSVYSIHTNAQPIASTQLEDRG